MSVWFIGLGVFWLLEKAVRLTPWPWDDLTIDLIKWGYRLYKKRRWIMGFSSTIKVIGTIFSTIKTIWEDLSAAIKSKIKSDAVDESTESHNSVVDGLRDDDDSNV